MWRKRSTCVGDLENGDSPGVGRRPEYLVLFPTCFLREGYLGLSCFFTARVRRLHVCSGFFQSVCWMSCFVFILKGEIWTQTHRENACEDESRGASTCRLDGHQGCRQGGHSGASCTGSEGASLACTSSWPPGLLSCLMACFCCLSPGSVTCVMAVLGMWYCHAKGILRAPSCREVTPVLHELQMQSWVRTVKQASSLGDGHVGEYGSAQGWEEPVKTHRQGCCLWGIGLSSAGSCRAEEWACVVTNKGGVGGTRAPTHQLLSAMANTKAPSLLAACLGVQSPRAKFVGVSVKSPWVVWMPLVTDKGVACVWANTSVHEGFCAHTAHMEDHTWQAVPCLHETPFLWASVGLNSLLTDNIWQRQLTTMPDGVTSYGKPRQHIKKQR